jgi:exodeoxyribonuclease VII large subunit
LRALERNLEQAMRRKLASLRTAVQQWERSLNQLSPRARLQQHAQRLDELEQRLQRAVRSRLERARVRLRNTEALLGRSSPARRLDPLRQRLAVARRRLPAAMQRQLQTTRERLEQSMRTLHAVSPLATLERGYAIVTDASAHVVTDASMLAPGAKIEARVARGSVQATVTGVIAPSSTSAGTLASAAQKKRRKAQPE